MNEKIFHSRQRKLAILLPILVAVIGVGMLMSLNYARAAVNLVSVIGLTVPGQTVGAGSTVALFKIVVTGAPGENWAFINVTTTAGAGTFAGADLSASSTDDSPIFLAYDTNGNGSYNAGVDLAVASANTLTGPGPWANIVEAEPSTAATGTFFLVAHVTSTATVGHSFTVSLPADALKVLAGGPPTPVLITPTSTNEITITGGGAPPGGNIGTSTISNLVLQDLDTTGFGLDGRDFTVSWTPSSTWNAGANGYQFTQIYIVSSSISLNLNNVNTDGCGGSCMTIGYFNQYSMATSTPPQFMEKDSAGVNWSTSTQYVAWVLVHANDSFITSSSIAMSPTYDSVADTNAPQIDHSPVHSAKASAVATIHAMVFDDQTTEQQFASPSGNVAFKLFYTSSTFPLSPASVDAVPVEGAGELYSFTVPTSSVPAAGGTVKYYLVATDASNNTRYFCANPSAASAADCQTSPFTINTVTISGQGRSVSGTVNSNANNVITALSGAKVWAGGFGGAVTTTNGSGNYTITGLPDNDAFEFTATKVGYTKMNRMETVGTADKTGINLNINAGSFGFYMGDGGGGDMGGAPHVVFSGPPDGMQGVQVGEKIRVGFNQPMDASTINAADATTSTSNVYLINTITGTKVAGTVTYCANSGAAGCSALFSMDNNTILFSPTSDLATSTPYTLIINENVKSQSGQGVQGNRTGGGHKINFTTIGNNFGAFSGDWGAQFNQGGQYLPPYVKSMTPAPGMTAGSNVKILLEFNMALDSVTIGNTNIVLRSGGTPVAGTTVTLDSNEHRFVTISHSSPLSSGEYEVQVKGGVRSTGGIPVRPEINDIAFSSKFNSSGSADNTAPTIYPLLSNNSTGVSVDTVFEFGASEQLAVDSVSNSNITMTRGATAVSVATNYDPGKNSIYVVPNDVLSPSTVYTITLNSGITDLTGANTLSTSTYTYTTGGVSTSTPEIREAQCDDYKCVVFFTKPMNHDTQVDSNWASSTLNHLRISLTQGGGSDKVVASTVISYDGMQKSISIENVGLTLGGGNFTMVVAGVIDGSGNLLSSGTIVGPVQDSKETFGAFGGGDMGMFGPPTGDFMGGGGIGGGEFKPQGFGNFTADQFAMGQADMAFAFNPSAGSDSNVFQVRFNPTVVVETGDQIVLTFPNGTTLTNTAFDTQSPFYNDFNQFAAGIVTSTAISVDAVNNKVTITLGVSGSPTANDNLTLDLKKIINPSIPKDPSTGGYTVSIQLVRGGTVLATKTTMPYFIMAAGTRTITINIYAGSVAVNPVPGADGTVYLHGGGPSGPMDKTVVLSDGDIASVDGTVASSIVYNNLNDGCYFVGTDPFITLGGVDYFGQMSPEPICVNSGNASPTKNIVLTSSAGGSTATVTIKMVDSNGDPFVFASKDIDIFGGGPGKFVVKTLTGVTTTASAGYQIKLNSNGNWFVGMGPAMPKGAASGKPTSLGAMPPAPLNLMVSSIDSSPSVSLAFSSLPPNVTFNDDTDTITYTFATAGKTIAGTVKDGSGNALANVEVFLHRQGFGEAIFGETNASGTFSLAVAEYGNYEIGTFKDGMPPVFKSIELRSESGDKIYYEGKLISGLNPLIITLKKAAYTISGKVLDANNNGIGNAPLFAIDANGNSVPGQSSTDGSYSLYVDNGTWTVRAELPPAKTDVCGTLSKTVVVSGASQASQNLTPSVSTCYTLTGTVSVGGTNLANVPLFIEEWNTTNNSPIAGGVKRGASTNSNGVYSVKLGAGTYRVGTWHPDYGELSATTTVSSDPTTRNITVASTDTITFNFTGGTATMNALIEVKNTTDKTKRISKQVSGLNSSAALTVQALTGYNYFVDVFGVGKFSGTVTTTAGADTVTIDLGVSSGEYITVTGTIYSDVSTTTGKSGALVTFTNASTTVSAATDANGQYSMKIKAGSYTVSDSLDGYVSTQATSVSFATNTSAYDFGGGSPDQTALVKANYTIEGTVSSSLGAAMTGGYVWGTNASGTIVTSPIDSTDGTYSLPVSNGVWTIKGIGPKHEETQKVGTVTISGSSQTGVNFSLTANSGNTPTSTAGIMASDVGGSMDDSSVSGIKLTAGQGVLQTGSGDVSLNFEKNYNAPDTTNFQALGNANFSITGKGNSTIKDLKGTAEIQIDYASLLAELPDGVSESSLQLAYYSPEKDEYVPVEKGFTIDVANNTITAQTDHFTDFVITYTAPSADKGVTVTEPGGSTAVTEGGSTDTVSYVLTAAPSANVTITPSASGSKVTLSPTSVTFTTGNWETPQSVTVTAVNDSDVEGSHSDTLTHAITSSDADYAAVVITNITVTITDNDSAPGGGGGASTPADTTPPTNTSISIAGGATSTVNTAVTLTLGATDASQMMVGNTSAFTSSTWETYATSKAWTLLTGLGTKTVYAKFRDTAGNISTAVSDTIELITNVTATPVTTTTPTSTPVIATTTVPVVPPVVCLLTMKSAYKTANSVAIFYITPECTKRAFNKANVFFTYFGSWNDVKITDATTLAAIPPDSLGFMPWGPKYDPKYGALVKIVADPKVYLLLGTEKYWINSEAVFNSLKYSWNWIEDIDADLLNKYTVGSEISYTNHHPNYTIVKYVNDSKVYRLEPDSTDATKQIRRHVKNETAFNTLNFRWDRIVTIPSEEIYTDGEQLQSDSTTGGSASAVFTLDLEVGDSGTEVENLQKKLIALGYLDASVTGYFGQATQAAVKEFQTAKGIRTTGNVGPLTRAELNDL